MQHHPHSTPQARLQHNRDYFMKLITTTTPGPFFLTISLTSNPFLKDKDSFRFLKYQLGEYNKRVQKNLVDDPYQMLTYQMLHSALSDLSQIDTRSDQLRVLDNLTEWYKQHSKLVQQRKDQGYIRYQTTNQLRHLPPLTKPNTETFDDVATIPSQIIDRMMAVYECSARTMHPELDIPSRRLNDYKRKIINIVPFAEIKEEAKANKILYPCPPKYVEPKHEQTKETNENQEKTEEQSQIVQPIQGQPAQAEVKEEGQPVPNQQDLGGFGQQPQQPQQDEPKEDPNDMLCPSKKIYISAVTSQLQTHNWQSQPSTYRQNAQQLATKAMQLRYMRKQQAVLRQKQQDQLQIDFANTWAKKKSMLAKQMQKKLQEMKFKPEFCIANEEPVKEERLTIADELRFGFTTAVRSKPYRNEFDLSKSELPPIGYMSFNENELKKDRLDSLKNKFGKLLNLAEKEQRESVPSMCQVTARRRGLSQIIRNHSHSKERLIQLQEVSRIKQKIARFKINLNLKALSKGLCLPENEEQTGQIFPQKELPSNPFMIEPKKKKKK